MVQTTSVALFCLLLAPSLAAPITNGQHARAEELTERDPNFFRSAFRAVRKVATPSNVMKAAAGLVFRNDAEDISQRDLESPESIVNLVIRDNELQLTDRDVEYLKDLAARDPNWFSSAFRAVKKVVTPPNIMKAGKFAAGLIFREDEMSQRDDEFQLTERDIEFLQDLAARNPNWFSSAFRAVKKVATPPNIMKAGKFAAGLIFREDAEDLAARELEDSEDLTAREPRSGSKSMKAKKHHKSEEVEGRENDDVFERYFDDYEIDDLN